ncbi:JAB domain-containing protein [Acanthopleuribacter pedis]|uniref:DNA repair protein RadC n=1 Tax=Acanthopleuribacter pedis TaxID=442870 RepID=A0A8J7Q110_9BACT|nr:DNA repair protein RadC [Acanthopleuribacter pedis]MBO1317199.1 DNA repair protein RadC [Acanthopleuribacter pedis]
MQKRINDLSPIDRPREKLLQRGPAHLSDHELIAALLGGGTASQPLHQLAGKVHAALEQADNDPSKALPALLKLSGIGPAKACQLAAALEYSRRRIRPAGLAILKPTDLLPLVQLYARQKQEHLLCASLNGANEILEIRVVSVGTADRSLIHPREVFADPLTDRACAIILAHNHPSGKVTPSEADIRVTGQIAAAGNLLGVPLLDHLIFNQTNHFSFADAGLL